MARKKRAKEEYVYIKAIVNQGTLSLEYKLKGSSVVGRMMHDEDVSGWKDSSILQVVSGLLDVPVGFPIELEHR
jgi:hypothetical protein